MPIEIRGILEDVETYEGKRGFGANITISSKINKKTKRVTFTINDKDLADNFTSYLDTDICIQIELNQNNFGTRLGKVLNISA